MNTTSIEGMQFLLCRDADVTKPCCKNLTYYRNGKLWCTDCRRPRGRLPPKVIAGLLVILGFYPEIMKEVHILRDRSELPNEDKSATDTADSDTGPAVVPDEPEAT